MFHSICSIRSAAPAPRPPAAGRKRPAPTGRALSCAAVYASEPQGITATHERNDARNRAPVPPFRRTSPMCRCKGRLGRVKRGIRNHIGVLSPFCLRRQTAASPGRRRRQLCTLTLRVKPPPAEGLPSAEGKEEKEAGTHSHFSQTSGQYPTVACLPFRTTGVFISVPSSSSFSFLSSS